jgi:hypothetical protein
MTTNEVDPLSLIFINFNIPALTLTPQAVKFSYKPSVGQRENGSFPCCVVAVFTGIVGNSIESCLLLCSNRGIPCYVTVGSAATSLLWRGGGVLTGLLPLQRQRCYVTAGGAGGVLHSADTPQYASLWRAALQTPDNFVMLRLYLALCNGIRYWNRVMK